MSATIESDAEDPPAWDASFELNFYTDANFTNELNAGIISITPFHCKITFQPTVR